MPQLPTHNEAELIERAKIDDAAFSILYETYFPKIYGYVMKRVGKIDESFAYYARVVSKGTYIADPARIQAVKNRGLFNVSEREEVTIE